MATAPSTAPAARERSQERGRAWLLSPKAREVQLAGAVVTVALAVRLVALAAWQRSLYAGHLFPDEGLYDQWARALLEGRPFPAADLSAVPAYLLAALYRLGGGDPGLARLWNVALGAAGCGVVYGVGRALGGRAVGLLAGLIAAAYGPGLVLSVTLLKEPLAFLLFATFVLLLLQELDAPRLPRLAALGGVAALLANVRPNAILAVGLALVLAIARRARVPRPARALATASALAAVGYLVGAAPWAVLGRASGRLASAPVGGFNLALGNYLPNGVPWYRPLPFVSAVPSEQGVQFTLEASRRAGRRLSPEEASRFWTRQVLGEAWAQPGAFLRHQLRKILALVNAHEEADNVDPGFVGQFVPFLGLPWLTFAAVFPLGLAGLVLAVREERRARALLAVALAYAATLVVFYSNLRIRLPLLALLIPFAALALARLGQLLWAVKSGERPARAALAGLLAVAGLGLLAEHLPLPGTGDLTAQLNIHAIALSRLGRTEEAERYFQRSAESGGAYAGFARCWLAAGAIQRGDRGRALAWLDGIEDGSFAAPLRDTMRGDSLRALGRQAEAAEAYERALQVNPWLRQPRASLIQVYQEMGSGRAEAHQRALYEITRAYQQ